MNVWAQIKGFWRRVRVRTDAYLANDDPLAEAANAGALLVWSSQPLYPLEIRLLVGPTGWIALLTWFSTPFFFGVPLLARRNAQAGRALFVTAGVGNTLIAAKAFGTASAVGWFLVPCALLVVGFFRQSEWRLVLALGAMIAASAVVIPHLGQPLQTYSAAAYASLTRVHLLGAGVLSIYLVYVGVRARRHMAKQRIGARA